MNTTEYVESLLKETKYHINAYSIGETSIMLFVDAVIPAQNEIPAFINEKAVQIVKAM